MRSSTRRPPDDGRAEVLTQLARVAGTSGRLRGGRRAHRRGRCCSRADAVARARIDLERGRLRRSSGDRDAALPLFESAFAIALDAEQRLPRGGRGAHGRARAPDRDGLRRVDERGIELAERHEAPRTGLGPLLNNLGWELLRGRRLRAGARRVRARTRRARARARERGRDRDRALRGREDAACARPLRRGDSAARAGRRVGDARAARPTGGSTRSSPRSTRRVGRRDDARRPGASRNPAARARRSVASPTTPPRASDSRRSRARAGCCRACASARARAWRARSRAPRRARAACAAAG